MKRILFVDDESKILDGIRRMLYADKKNWEMEFAEVGEAALRKCEMAAFVQVISDMRMPECMPLPCWATFGTAFRALRELSFPDTPKSCWPRARFPWHTAFSPSHAIPQNSSHD